MSENKWEGFVFSTKYKASESSRKDVSITVSTGRDKNREVMELYSFTIRNECFEMLTGSQQRYIKFGLKQAQLYFIPVKELNDGFSFHHSTTNKSKTNHYSTVRVKSFPALRPFLKDKTQHYTMKYDKGLELYYVDLHEED